MIADIELLYRQHLTDADRQLLVAAAGEGVGIAAALSHPAAERAVFSHQGDDRPLMAASPFLTFAVGVHRTAAHLESVTFVDEWVGPRQRIPVFDVPRLRDLLASPPRRYFLVELLASYTHLASGVTWERTRRGWRRRKFSELDPVRLAAQLEVVEPPERPGVYRRLGDLALFLTGVFPDHASLVGVRGIDAARLVRSSDLSADQAGDLAGIALLTHLGSRWYRLAAASAAGVPSATLATAAEVGERFDDARRVLNVVTDRYLFPVRDGWFGRR